MYVDIIYLKFLIQIVFTFIFTLIYFLIRIKNTYNQKN